MMCASLWAVRAVGQDLSALGKEELEARVGQLFARSCARSGCHTGPVPQMNLDLGAGQFVAATVGVPSQENPALQRVHPGQPEQSYLMMKVKGEEGIIGVQMPFTGDKLTDEEVRTIEAWFSKLTDADVGRASASAAEQPAYPFNGWKVINLPTTRALDAGSWLFLISHRFNPRVGDGYDAFFGLDGSGIINLSLGYAFTDRLLVALSRSNSADDVELQARYHLASQTRRLPVEVGIQGAVNWVSEKPVDPDVSRLRGEALKFTGQVSITRALGPRVGLALVPGISTNPAENVEGEDPNITLGLGARWTFYRNLALVAEWVPILSGYTRTTTFGNDIRFDTWGGALEITTGGHVFQIVVSNSVGLTTDQYLRGGDLDIRDGDVRLGFNIFRILNF